MSSTAFTAQAGSDGTATVTIPPVLSGLQWTISQSSIESIPLRGGASCTTKLNGNMVTTSQVIPATASGAPAINVQAGDVLTYQFAGLTQGDTAKVTIFYNESQWGSPPNYSWV